MRSRIGRIDGFYDFGVILNARNMKKLRIIGFILSAMALIAGLVNQFVFVPEVKKQEALIDLNNIQSMSKWTDASG